MSRPLAAFAAAPLTVLAAVGPFATARLAAAGNANPPTVTTAGVSDRSDTEITVRDQLDDLGNATAATVWFEY